MTVCREFPVRYTNGYGKRYIRGSKPYRSVLVHRWVWEQINGPIPEGLEVMHICDNRACYRLDHLRLGTHSDNMRDMHTKGRAGGGRKWRATHCPQGHAHAEHAYYDKNNGPHCRVCDAARHREARRVRSSV